jgi:hypothetical protein
MARNTSTVTLPSLGVDFPSISRRCTASFAPRTVAVPSHTAIRPAVFQTAASGDPVAVGIVSTFGRELGLLATNLIDKFALGGTASFVIASGSLFTRTGPLLFDVFQRTVHGADATARVRLNRRPPVAGAVRAALQSWGVHTDADWETASSSYEGALNT